MCSLLSLILTQSLLLRMKKRWKLTIALSDLWILPFDNDDPVIRSEDRFYQNKKKRENKRTGFATTISVIRCKIYRNRKENYERPWIPLGLRKGSSVFTVETEDRGFAGWFIFKINRTSSRLLFRVRILTIRITRLFEGRSGWRSALISLFATSTWPLSTEHPSKITKHRFLECVYTRSNRPGNL